MEAKVKALIDKLLVKTQRGETLWEKVGDTEQYTIKISGTKVAIDKYRSRNTFLYYGFSIINSKGETILEINAKKPENVIFGIESDYDVLKKLHEEVKWKYFKVDETIDNLLNEADQQGQIGEKDLPF